MVRIFVNGKETNSNKIGETEASEFLKKRSDEEIFNEYEKRAGEDLTKKEFDKDNKASAEKILLNLIRKEQRRCEASLTLVEVWGLMLEDIKKGKKVHLLNDYEKYLEKLREVREGEKQTRKPTKPQGENTIKEENNKKEKD